MGEVVLLWKPGLPLTTTVLRKKIPKPMRDKEDILRRRFTTLNAYVRKRWRDLKQTT